MLKDTTLQQRKEIVSSKVKKMSEFAFKKLDMKGRDIEQIENLKQRLQSIDQVELKKKLLQKGLGNFVLEQYLEKHNIAVDGKKISDIVSYGKWKNVIELLGITNWFDKYTLFFWGHLMQKSNEYEWITPFRNCNFKFAY